jgi:serralysin
MFREEFKENIKTIDMNETIDINNKSKNINLLAITYKNKWENKDDNNITIVTYSFRQSILKEFHYYRLKSDVPISGRVFNVVNDITIHNAHAR